MAYCTKTETRAGEPVFVGKINMKDKQGQRSDLIGLREQHAHSAYGTRQAERCGPD